MEQRPAYLRRGRGRGFASPEEPVIGNGRGIPRLPNGIDHIKHGVALKYGNPITIRNDVRGTSKNVGPVKNINVSNNNSNLNSSENAAAKCSQVVKVVEHVSHDPKEGTSKVVGASSHHRNSGEEIFRAAAATHQEATKRQLSSTDDFLLSDDDDDEDEEFHQKKEAVLSNFLKRLNSSACDISSSAGDLGRTAMYIEGALKSKANICLICIENVTQKDPVWNCSGCYTMFHIQCIQQWIRDGVQHKSTLSTEHFPNKEKPWFCPKCRHEYQQNDFPKFYTCFCGKEANPPFDPWGVPHSCGQTCGRQLKPDCGHQCLLQCHPGPCPPCPKTTRSRCFCGKSSEQVRRCGAARWSCGLRCGRPLNCGHHLCSLPCHEGDCRDCPETSQQPCTCRRKTAIVPCATPVWKCDQVCNKPLSCGHHKCEVVCHSGACQSCSKDGKRKCPCGKTTFDLPCTEEAPTCLESCGKLLDCGLHRCTNRCHQGSCGMCREMIRKKCRCGKREKELQCFKDFQCDVKCTNLKDCGVHQCKRKCCDGNCPPCTSMCGKPLKCRQHKCANTCHLGPCYPCTNMAVLKCNCGKTMRTVPCGVEKKTRPPKCNKPCSNPPDCHHPSRTPHHCHFGECPKCSQVCDKPLVGCSHSCPALCHSAVKVEVKDTQPKVGPWQVSRELKRFEVVNKACPPCLVPVPVTCFGKHETTMVRCSKSDPSSCQRSCGRRLPCLNHTCQLLCHVVDGVADDDVSEAGSNCKQCEEPCTKPRPPGCIHSCLLPCHPGHCPPCTQMIKMRCHCQMVVKHVPCDEWCSANGVSGGTKVEALRSCGCRCPKLLSCSHRCKAVCHSGDCPPVLDCSEKVKVRCPCGRRREEFLCHEVQSGKGKVDCNKACEVEKEKARKALEASQRAAAEQEALKKKEEMEEFEKRSKGKRKRQRRQDVEDDGDGRSFFARKQTIFIISLLMIIFSLFVYKLLFHV